MSLHTMGLENLRFTLPKVIMTSSIYYYVDFCFNTPSYLLTKFGNYKQKVPYRDGKMMKMMMMMMTTTVVVVMFYLPYMDHICLLSVIRSMLFRRTMVQLSKDIPALTPI